MGTNTSWFPKDIQQMHERNIHITGENTYITKILMNTKHMGN